MTINLELVLVLVHKKAINLFLTYVNKSSDFKYIPYTVYYFVIILYFLLQVYWGHSNMLQQLTKILINQTQGK